MPTLLGDMGSGSIGAAGGGAIKLTSLENFVITAYSSISMNGESGTSSGGGAGGVILINTPAFESRNDNYGYPSSLSLNANGGSAALGLGGGAGGRIKVSANSILSNIYMSASGGTGDNYNSSGNYSFSGANGTIYKTQLNGSAGTLEISSGISEKRTMINSFLGVSSLKISGGSFDLENGITYPTLNINGGKINAKSNFSTNNSLSINGGVLVVSESNVSFSELIINSNGELHAMSPTANYGNLIVNSGGKITYPAERGSNPTNKLYVKAANIDIQSGGKIDVTGKGYSSTFGPGAGTSMWVGGTHSGAGASNITTTYGSATDPNSYGSGGYGSSGDNPNYGYWEQGSGGGIVRIEATNQLIVNGQILSNSIDMGCCIGFASGAGGSIFIKSASLSGSGEIRADAGTIYSGGRGGGGRVAIYYTNKTFTGTMSAAGNVNGTVHDAGPSSYAGAPSP